jgi:hypothetical protein
MLLIPLDVLAADITLAWEPSPGTVAGYRVYYGVTPGVYTLTVDAGTQTTRTIQGLTGGVRYYFVVRAYSSAGLESANSNEVNAVPDSLLSFTDDPLLPGVHQMKAVHMTELQGRINGLRKTRGLAAMSWTPLAAGTIISAAHVSQLRSALNAVYQSLGLAAPIYLDDPLTPGTSIKATHIVQLRTFVRALE